MAAVDVLTEIVIDRPRDEVARFAGTFASHPVMRGVPLKAVQELLGHATIEMTMRY